MHVLGSQVSPRTHALTPAAWLVPEDSGTLGTGPHWVKMRQRTPGLLCKKTNCYVRGLVLEGWAWVPKRPAERRGRGFVASWKPRSYGFLLGSSRPEEVSQSWALYSVLAPAHPSLFSLYKGQIMVPESAKDSLLISPLCRGLGGTEQSHV